MSIKDLGIMKNEFVAQKKELFYHVNVCLMQIIAFCMLPCLKLSSVLVLWFCEGILEKKQKKKNYKKFINN